MRSPLGAGKQQKAKPAEMQATLSGWPSLPNHDLAKFPFYKRKQKVLLGPRASTAEQVLLWVPFSRSTSCGGGHWCQVEGGGGSSRAVRLTPGPLRKGNLSFVGPAGGEKRNLSIVFATEVLSKEPGGVCVCVCVEGRGSPCKQGGGV